LEDRSDAVPACYRGLAPARGTARRIAGHHGDIHELPQHLAAARQARAHGADRHIEDLGDFFVAHALETDQQDHGPLLLGNHAKRAFHVPELELLALGRRGSEIDLGLAQGDR